MVNPSDLPKLTVSLQDSRTIPLKFPDTVYILFEDDTLQKALYCTKIWNPTLGRYEHFVSFRDGGFMWLPRERIIRPDTASNILAEMGDHNSKSTVNYDGDDYDYYGGDITIIMVILLILMLLTLMLINYFIGN